MTIRLSVIVTCFIFVTTGALLSQGAQPDRERIQERIDRTLPPHEAQVERERIKERIEMIRIWKMTETLDLTKKQGDQLFSPLGEFEKRRKELFEERDRVMRELANTARGENPDEEVLKELLKQLERFPVGLDKLREEEMLVVKGVLTTVQQARYIVFKETFDRELRNIIRDSRGGPPRDKRPPGRF